MEIYEKLLKSISETSYLNTGNTERYRVIIRYFFEQYENLQYWLYKEDIFEMMIKYDIFQDYTIEKCQGDLQQLSQWGNLTYVQDTSKVMSLTEYQNRKFRYRISSYTVEIERMTLKLENLEIEGASLSPTLLERIKEQIQMTSTLRNKSDAEIAGWWKSLSSDFMRLNHDYQDYISTLNGAHAEEMMKSREFLIFKDKLVTYLRTFVKSLQEQALLIERILQDLEEETLTTIFHKIADYEISIPRMEGVIHREDVLHSCNNRWSSICRWFVGVQESDNEVYRLNMITNEIIRKITRYATQIGELHNQGANRKEEYRNIATIFGKCESMMEAHRMSSLVFGVDYCMHFKELASRATDSINSGVYEETPTYYDLEVRTRIVRNKTERKAAQDYEMDKRMQRIALENEMDTQRKLTEDLMKNGRISFSELPCISSKVRKILLGWLSNAIGDKQLKGKTDANKAYRIEREEGECILHCEDGDLVMPNFSIYFEEDSL